MPNPKPEEHVVHVLTGDEVARMLRVAGKDRQLGIRDTAIISILFDGGLRASELCSLRVEDVDLEGMLYVQKGKGGRPRIASIGKQALRALDRWVRRRAQYLHALKWIDAEKVTSLFVSRTGGELTTAALRSIVARAAKDAGIERRIHPHFLRHSSATHLANAGLEESELRAIFGWQPDEGAYGVEPKATLTTAGILPARIATPLLRPADGRNMRPYGEQGTVIPDEGSFIVTTLVIALMALVTFLLPYVL